MSFRSTMAVKNIKTSILITMIISVGMSTGLSNDSNLGEHLRNQTSFDERPLSLSDQDSIIHRVHITNIYKNIFCFKDLTNCAVLMHWNTFKKNILITVRHVDLDFISYKINNETQVYLLQDQLVADPTNNKKNCRSGGDTTTYSICDYIININMNANNPTKNCYSIRVGSKKNQKNVQKPSIIGCKKIFNIMKELSVPMTLTTVGTFKYFYKHIDLGY